MKSQDAPGDLSLSRYSAPVPGCLARDGGTQAPGDGCATPGHSSGGRRGFAGEPLDTAAVEIHTPVVALAVPSQFGPATYRLGTADSTPAAVSRCTRHKPAAVRAIEIGRTS